MGVFVDSSNMWSALRGGLIAWVGAYGGEEWWESFGGISFRIGDAVGFFGESLAWRFFPDGHLGDEGLSEFFAYVKGVIFECRERNHCLNRDRMERVMRTVVDSEAVPV